MSSFIQALIKHLVAFAFFLGLPVVLFGQTYSFKTYSLDDGLPQTYVQTIVQDHKGYIWLGTSDGLSKFNGKHFVTFTRKDKLAENTVACSFVDTLNGLTYFGHANGAISVIDNEGRVNQLKLPGGREIKHRVHNLYIDSKKQIWVSTLGEGLYIIKDSTSLLHYSSENSIIGDNVFCVTEDKQYNTWIATQEGTVHFNNTKFLKVNLPPHSAYAVECSEDSSIWIGTNLYGLYIVKSYSISSDSSKAIEPIYYTLDKTGGLAHVSVFSLLKDSKNNIWAGTYGGGVSRITINGNNDYKIKSFDVSNGVPNNIIYSIIEDKEGNIWLGTLGGACVIRSGDEEFELIDSKNGFLRSDQVWSVEKYGSILWVGTDLGVSSVQFTKSDNIIPGKMYLSTTNGLKDDKTLSMLYDPRVGLWCGTRQGLSLLPNGSEKFKVYDVCNQAVSSIAKDGKGNLWIGSWDGAYRFNPSTGDKEHFSTDNILKNNVVNKVIIDSKNNKWFATEGGLTLLKSDGTHKVFNKENKLPNENVYCIAEDLNGKIWIGTQEGGVYEYNGNEFINYTTENGFSSDNIYSLIIDNENNVWAGTSSGVDKFDQKTKQVVHYGKAEGFLGVETNLNAAFKDKQGRLWFGTVNGLVKYNPDKKAHNKHEPLTYITGVKIFLKDTLKLDQHEISYKQNHLTFSFIGLSYTVPEKVRYQFMLEGFDNDWLPVTDKNEVTYSNIPHGTYTFKVRACNNNNIWNNEPTTYSFVITPPFWKTTWFIILCIVLVAGSIYLYIRVRTQKLEKAKLILEQQVIERTQEVVQQKQEIEQKNKDITDSITYARRIQLALLPHKHEIKKRFQDSFIFYRPRDIVSGDLYWFSETKGKCIVAAVDCTGHGVPGAFMSIVANSSLNEIVNERGITNPGEILTALDEKVTNTLKQDSRGSDTRDGMDVALCSFDLKNKTLEYAGANRPLMIVKNESLTKIKGSSFPVGSYIGTTKVFEKHLFEVTSGDTFYIFSDGYPDQFGGPKGKKFMIKKFEELIKKVQGLTMSEQENFLKSALKDWQGNHESVDDILVIGIKV